MIVRRGVYFGEERLFARRDYEGLTKEQADILRKRRSDYAKVLKKHYRDTMADIDKYADVNSIETIGKYTGGGVGTNYNLKSVRESGQTASQFRESHKNRIREQLRRDSKGAAAIMRGEALESQGGKVLSAVPVAESEAVERAAIKAAKKAESKAIEEAAKEVAEKVVEKATEKAEGKAGEEVAKKVAKEAKGLGSLGKGALIGAGVLGTAYGAKQLYDRKKRRERY